MRTVFDSSMLAHVWANRSQDSGRTANQNFYFTGPALYSYDSHFIIAAHLDDGRILWNSSSYSNSTSKHQNHAWRALSRVQADKRVFVPSLNSNTWRNLEYLRTDGDGRKLPTLAQNCADEIIRIAGDMTKMREGYSRIESAFSSIRGLEQSGRALCEYVAKGKRAPAWPLPSMPEQLPRGDALKAMLRSIAKNHLLTCHAGALHEAGRGLETVRRIIARGFDAGYQIQNIRGSLDGIARNIASAESSYKTATGRKSAKARAMWQEHKDVSAPALALLDEWLAETARYEVLQLLREVFRHIRSRGAATNPAWPTRYLGRRDSGYLASKFKDTLTHLPGDEAAGYAPILARVQRCNDWDICENGRESALSSFETAQSYGTKHPGDAIRFYLQAAQHAASTLSNPEYAALRGDEMRALANRAHSEGRAIRTQLEALNAQAIEDWKNGTRESLSFDAGTFARIKGDSVQTSRGATVPLQHACRLARIARRIIAAGGRDWSDGSGPSVGHFRVQSIRADGQTIIGCHTFEPAEALRMLAILEGCEACAKTADESEGA